MTRGRLGLLLFALAAAVVVVLGLTRSTNDTPPADNEPPDGRTFTPSGDPYLQPDDESITVPEDAPCQAAAVSPSRSLACEGFQVGDHEMAWLVEQTEQEPPVVSFLRRESATEYTRILKADGAGPALFDRVNVRMDDLTGDGSVEAVFAFHLDDLTGVDVVEPDGDVIDHFDLNDGQVKVGDNMLTTWVREDDGWRREEITYGNGQRTVESSEHVSGPAEGNL